MVSRDFAVRWARFDKADVTAGHFVSCAVAGQWIEPEIAPLGEAELHRLRSGAEIGRDIGVFLLVLVLLPFLFLIGFVAGPAIGSISFVLLIAAVWLSYRNFRREVRARRD